MPNTFRVAGLLCGILIAGVPALSSTHALTGKRAPTKPSAQEAAAPAEPQIPPTPEEMAPTPPRVTMQGGQLSIVAENSTLGDVLNAVRRATGAAVEIPGSANSERIVVHLGPGEPQAVLQQLFEGSKFNYVILGSPDNSSSIKRIILTARTPGGVGPTGPVNNASNYYPAANQPVHSMPAPDYQAEGGVDDEIVQPEPVSPEENTQSTEGQEQQGDQQYSGPGGEAQQQQEQQRQGPKTPEQLLQELQRMQQQQQQQQGDQTRAPRGAVEPE